MSPVVDTNTLAESVFSSIDSVFWTNWLVGISNGNSKRKATVDFSFLEKGKKYMVTIYRDYKEAHYKTNPQAY
ncbi:MAG: glycoside hydrolase family 97 C-terminal domain-containing protein [Flavobacteriaceae bacterium]